MAGEEGLYDNVARNTGNWPNMPPWYEHQYPYSPSNGQSGAQGQGQLIRVQRPDGSVMVMEQPPSMQVPQAGSYAGYGVPGGYPGPSTFYYPGTSHVGSASPNPPPSTPVPSPDYAAAGSTTAYPSVVYGQAYTPTGAAPTYRADMGTGMLPSYPVPQPSQPFSAPAAQFVYSYLGGSDPLLSLGAAHVLQGPQGLPPLYSHLGFDFLQTAEQPDSSDQIESAEAGGKRKWKATAVKRGLLAGLGALATVAAVAAASKAANKRVDGQDESAEASDAEKEETSRPPPYNPNHPTYTDLLEELKAMRH